MRDSEEVTEVPGTSPPSGTSPSSGTLSPPEITPPSEKSELPADVLRVQKPVVIKAKKRPREAMNKS